MFNAFLQEKTTTQDNARGDTDEFYLKEGTLPKSSMLVRLHPDVAKLCKRWGRVHHYVDYSRFKKTRLIRRQGLEVAASTNDYGMQLVRQ